MRKKFNIIKQSELLFDTAKLSMLVDIVILEWNYQNKNMIFYPFYRKKAKMIVHKLELTIDIVN